MPILCAFSSYGFPIEIIEELAKETGKSVDIDEFSKGARKSTRTFPGQRAWGSSGAGDQSDKVTAFHTATHLMLRRTSGTRGIGHQAGSNITDERTCFDFTFRKGSREVPDRVEELRQYGNRFRSVGEIRDHGLKKPPEQPVSKGVWGQISGKVTVYQVEGPDGSVYSGTVRWSHVKRWRISPCFGRFKSRKKKHLRRVSGVSKRFFRCLTIEYLALYNESATIR